MTNNANLPPIPAQRYFSLDELCRLADICPEQFRQWQQENGTVVGHGGETYTRRDVIKARQFSGSFPAYIDRFNLNGLDSQGRPAADAEEIQSGLQEVLRKIETALAK